MRGFRPMKYIKVFLVLIALVLIMRSPVMATVSVMPSESGAMTDFIGTSGDTKPTPTNRATLSSHVINGSRFFEYDTQTWYIYNPTTGWVIIPSPDTP